MHEVIPMNISKEQAGSILNMVGFCDGEGQLGCGDATMDLLEAIVIAYPDLLGFNSYIYRSIADMNWYLTRLPEDQALPRAERPKRPAGWWKPGVTIEGLPAQ
jgi:hypothetical protein